MHDNVQVDLNVVDKKTTSSAGLECIKILRDKSSNVLNSSFDRAVTKEGICNYIPTNAARQNWKFLTDIFTTVVELRWRWTLLAFCVVYFGSWLAFAILWYLVLYIHGDTTHFDEEGWTPCITGIKDFTAAFLFSVETQHTTGYGFYEITTSCSSAIILFCVQSIVGVILEGMMVGMVFVKIQRSKKRSETLMFSKNGVVSMRDGILCFMFRVGDMRKSHLLEARITAQLIRNRTTMEGEVITNHMEELELQGDGERKNKLLLLWPTTVIHKITDSSPLKYLSPDDLCSSNNSFEIIVVLEGIVESTGLSVQAISSYLPGEILWGRRFKDLGMSGFRVDYSIFHETEEIETKEKIR